MATAVKNDTFEQEVIQSDIPVLVDFWAEWCGPCHAVAPVLDRIVEEQAGGLKLVKVNIDENPEVAQAFRVQSIPLVVALKDGAVVDGFLGAQPAAVVEEFVAGLVPTEEQLALQRLGWRTRRTLADICKDGWAWQQANPEGYGKG